MAEKKKKTDEAETPVVDQVDSAEAEPTTPEPEPDATPVEETVDEVPTEPASEDRDTGALQKFNEDFMQNPRLKALVLSVGDGLGYAVKIS